jgi:membrane protease YdiL (CAAX protease family)
MDLCWYTRSGKALSPLGMGHRLSIGESLLNCNACGYLGRDGDAFCYSCGKPLTGQESESPSLTEVAPGTVTWRSGQVAIGILLILVCVLPVTGIAILMGKLAGRFELALAAWESSHLMGFAILIVVWRLGLRPRRLSLASLGLVAPSPSLALTALFAVLVLVGSLSFTWVYANAVEYVGWEMLSPPDIPDGLVFPGLAALATYEALAMWTPLTEEIFFRGFVFAGLTPRLGVPRAIIVSALVFSAFHLSIGVLLPIFVTGMLLAWLYHRTGSLWPGIAAHAGQNALAVSAVIIGG